MRRQHDNSVSVVMGRTFRCIRQGVQHTRKKRFVTHALCDAIHGFGGFHGQDAEAPPPAFLRKGSRKLVHLTDLADFPQNEGMSRTTCVTAKLTL
eukprot:1367354-Amphidinium_carterae.1